MLAADGVDALDSNGPDWLVKSAEEYGTGSPEKQAATFANVPKEVLLDLSDDPSMPDTNQQIQRDDERDHEQVQAFQNKLKDRISQ